MANILSFFYQLKPSEMSLIMMVVMIVDIWSALRLKFKIGEGFLSRKFLHGVASDLLLILLPILLIVAYRFIGAPSKVGALQIISLMIMLLYLIGTVGSIISNILAFYPENTNKLTEFLYRLLKNEVARKLGIDVKDLDSFAESLKTKDKV